MELNKLQGFVLLLILVGMVLGVGVLIMEKFAYSVPNDGRANDTLASPTNGSNTHELDNGNISATPATIVYNSTGETIPASQYTLTENATDGNRAYWTAVGELNDSMTASIYITYGYKDYNTETRTVATSTMTEIGNISTNWIGLIVTVAILAIILVLVIGSFGAMRR